MALDDKVFDFIAAELKKRSGLSISKQKEYLLESRLQPIAREQGIANVVELLTKVMATRDNAMLERITDAMTTNESMFFRDTKPFEQIKQIVLPALMEKNLMRPIRIWSAACSTGQEVYSLLMTLEEEKAKYPNLRYEIIGSDISPTVVKKAQEGIYTQFEIQRGLPIQMLLKYFEQRENNQWQVKENLRKAATFKEMNLLDPYASLGKLDLILCRNVLIYFDEKGKSDVLNRCAGVLNDPGFLFLGSAETIMGLTTSFKPHSLEARGVFVPAE